MEIAKIFKSLFFLFFYTSRLNCLRCLSNTRYNKSTNEALIEKLLEEDWRATWRKGYDLTFHALLIQYFVGKLDLH